MKKFVEIGVGLFLLCGVAKAEERPTISLVLDNDSFIRGGDRHYTNGLYGSWTGIAEARDDDLTAVAQAVMPAEADGALWREGYFFGQSIFTPTALSRAVPPTDDRPYAGWLFGGMRLYRDNGASLDKIEATIGMVGPASLAGDTQQWWHGMGLLGGVKPRGWGYQLRNEPGLVLSEQRIWRVPLSEGPLQVEALPQMNVSLGNIFTHAGGGVMLRMGQGLAADWGPSRIEPGTSGADFQKETDFSWYLFGGVEGRAVARNIFLDGNTFQDSRRVERKILVGDLNLGAAASWGQTRLTASYVRRSLEFNGQRGADEFVSISASFAD